MKESQPSPNRLVPLWTNRARTMLYFIWYQKGLTWNERGSYYRIVSLFNPPSPTPFTSKSYYLFCQRTLKQKTRAFEFRYSKVITIHNYTKIPVISRFFFINTLNYSQIETRKKEANKSSTNNFNYQTVLFQFNIAGRS